MSERAARPVGLLDAPPLPAMIATIAVATAGGGIFAWAGAPLAWMLGAMLVTTAGTLMGAPLVMAKWLRTGMVAVLGVMLGSAFSPALVEQVAGWLPAVGILVVFVATITALAFVYFRFVAGYDRVTAYFSSAPGGLSEMAIVGEAMGGDTRIISLVHATRILVVVSVIPFYFRLVEGVAVPTVPGNATALSAFTWQDALLLAGAAVAGFPLARLIKVPAPALVGPMAISAGLHLSGTTAAAPPSLLIAAAQIVIGAGIGCRFAGLQFADIRKVVLTGLGSGILMCIAAGVAGPIAHLFTEIPTRAYVLALAPGGLAEMSLIALSIGFETAFVSTLHILRIVIVVIAIPLVFRLLARPD